MQASRIRQRRASAEESGGGPTNNVMAVGRSGDSTDGADGPIIGRPVRPLDTLGYLDPEPAGDQVRTRRPQPGIAGVDSINCSADLILMGDHDSTVFERVCD